MDYTNYKSFKNGLQSGILSVYENCWIIIMNKETGASEFSYCVTNCVLQEESGALPRFENRLCNSLFVECTCCQSGVLHLAELNRDVCNTAIKWSRVLGARAAENKDTTAQRANFSTVGCSTAQSSGKHLLTVLRSKSEPITREKHSPWSACPRPISGQLLMTATRL